MCSPGDVPPHACTPTSCLPVCQGARGSVETSAVSGAEPAFLGHRLKGLCSELGSRGSGTRVLGEIWHQAFTGRIARLWNHLALTFGRKTCGKSRDIYKDVFKEKDSVHGRIFQNNQGLERAVLRGRNRMLLRDTIGVKHVHREMRSSPPSPPELRHPPELKLCPH